MSSDGCLFCGIVAGTVAADVVAEHTGALAFMDANPAADGHVLVVPKTHVRTILDLGDDDAAAVMQLAATVARSIDAVCAPDGLSLFQSNEAAGGQDVFHLHVHVVPRYVGDAFVEPWPSTVAAGDRAALAVRLRAAIER
jgi:histidine triad (HIT) family protein